MMRRPFLLCLFLITLCSLSFILIQCGVGVDPSDFEPNLSTTAEVPGTLDSAFGTAGISFLSTHISTAGENYKTSTIWGAWIALGTNGKTFVLGTQLGGAMRIGFLNRLSSNGALEDNFGTNGKSNIGSGAYYPRGIGLDSEERALAVGNQGLGSFRVSRILSSGNLDTTFATNGSAVTAEVGIIDPSGVFESPQNKVVAFGSGTGVTSTLAFRYMSNGRLDTSFHSDGKTALGLTAGSDQANAARQLNSGEIIFAVGGATAIGTDFMITRIQSDGQLDNGFATSGKNLTDFSGSDDSTTFMAVQTDGKYLLVGYATVSGVQQIGIVRYDTSGAVDATFGSNGKLTTSILDGGAIANTAVIDEQGRLIVAGRANNGTQTDGVVARYLTNGILDTRFGTAGLGFVTLSVGVDDNFTGIALSSDGILVSGAALSTTNSDFDTYLPFVLKLKR